MAVNKVVFGTTVLVDLTGDTVTPETLLQGRTAHGKDGAPIVGTLDPASPWKNVEVGSITPTSGTTHLAADTTKGTPVGMVICLMNTNSVSISSNAIIAASWATSPTDAVYAKSVYYYKTASSRSSTTTYPTYSNGSFSLNKTLKAGWTYYYCIVYGN